MIKNTEAEFFTMKIKKDSEKIEKIEKPDEWWYRIYAAVIIFTVFVITALYLFTKYFS